MKPIISTGKVRCVRYEDKDTGETINVIQLVNLCEWKNIGKYHAMRRAGHKNVRYGIATITSNETYPK